MILIFVLISFLSFFLLSLVFLATNGQKGRFLEKYPVKRKYTKVKKVNNRPSSRTARRDASYLSHQLRNIPARRSIRRNIYKYLKYGK